MPTQGRSACGKTEWLKKWKCRESLCNGLGWKYKMGYKNPDNSPRKGEGWRRKAMRRTTTKWRTSSNEDTTTKWITTTNITKISLEVFPSKVTSLELFYFKKNDYRSVIIIAFISNIIYHMLVISIFNKNDGWCWRYIKRWVFLVMLLIHQWKPLSNIKNESI